MVIKMNAEITKKLVAIPKKEIKGISEAAAIGIRLEAEARDFYKKHAEKTSDVELKSAFEFLVKEEQEHFAALTAVQEILKQKGKFAVIKGTALKHLQKPKIFGEKKAGLAKEKQQNELTVLLWAMRTERKTELFYKEQAEKTKSKEVKKFFETLAEFEAGHFAFLDSMMQGWTNVNDLIMG